MSTKLVTEFKYENCYVAFLDVMGFKELVFNPKKKALLENYFREIQKAFSIFSHAKDKIKHIAISDSVILITQDLPEALRKVVKIVKE